MKTKNNLFVKNSFFAVALLLSSNVIAEVAVVAPKADAKVAAPVAVKAPVAQAAAADVKAEAPKAEVPAADAKSVVADVKAAQAGAAAEGFLSTYIVNPAKDASNYVVETVQAHPYVAAAMAVATIAIAAYIAVKNSDKKSSQEELYS